jgi:DNA-binding beta-propeller fold protein YncE
MFVVAAGSIFSGQTDSVASFTPAFQFNATSGFSPVNPISLPSLLGQSSSIVALSETGNVVTATLQTPLLACPSCGVPNVATPITVPVGSSVVVSGESTTGYNGTFVISSINVISVTGTTTITYSDLTATGLAPCPTVVNTITVPCSSGGAASIPGQPVYLASNESASMYVANFNSNSVSKIDVGQNVVSDSATVEPPSVTSTSPAANPVSMAEASTPNGSKLYVANQGNSTISSLNTVDLSANTVTGFTGTNPVWIVARSDGQRVYVVTQGDGQLATIDTSTDMALPGTASVGAGANFIFYDPHLNRLYVTNPVTSTVFVFSDTGGANDTPVQLAQISFDIGSAPCSSSPQCSAVAPVSVTALPDGSRFYVASYQTESACTDPLAGTTGACMIAAVTVFNANNFAPEYPTTSTSSPTLALLTDPPFAANVGAGVYQMAVPQVTACGPMATPPPTTLYSPGMTRFRVFTTASADSSRVYASICDAGVIAVINTTNSNTNNPGSINTPADTVLTDLPAAFSAGPVQSNGLPPNQNPIFLLTGQ